MTKLKINIDINTKKKISKKYIPYIPDILGWAFEIFFGLDGDKDYKIKIKKGV